MPDTTGAPVLVEVVSGSFVESRHCGAVAVADHDGQLLMACGDVDRLLPASDSDAGVLCLADLARRVASETEQLLFVGGSPPLARRLAAATEGAANVHILPGGVCVAALRNRHLGIALWVEDAAPRAIGAAMLALLRTWGAVPDSHLGDLAALLSIRNARGDVIATVRARIGLDG